MTRAVALATILVAVACGGEDELGPGGPHAISVEAFEPGEQAGFGQENLPDVVLGPPRGAGEGTGSLDVLSLGVGGEIVLELGVEATDEPGADLIVFENAFHAGGTGPLFAEPATVSVSADGDHWVAWPCDAEADGYPGCAGVSPVYANADDNDIDPTDPDEAGGDAFDLADIGVETARFVRIVDSGIDRGFGAPSGGFDLDAVAVVHPR